MQAFQNPKKICVIGAGPSGLVSAKYVLHYGYECDVFEQTDTLGGNWVYKDCTDVDEHGIEVYSCMYKDLVTNVPKEIMEYSDFKYSKNIKESYIGCNEILDYLRAYAKKFNLVPHIKYCHAVKKILPSNENKWLITVKDLKKNITHCIQYDAVFVCNGRFRCPSTPKIVGQNLFEGSQIHSRNFRICDPYQEQNVLIVGGYHSAEEISTLICKVAKNVFISCRKSPKMIYPPNLIQKPEVTQLTTSTAFFTDGSSVGIDSIVYCTGYEYSCNFLTDECGVKVENNGVAPLYKQIINIEKPTMYFIGLPFLGSGNVTFDLQVRFAMAALTKTYILPSKESMLNEWEHFLEKKDKANIPRKHVHRLRGPAESELYSHDLAVTANIAPIPPVMFKLYRRVCECRSKDYRYVVIDNETFEEIVL